MSEDQFGEPEESPPPISYRAFAVWSMLIGSAFGFFLGWLIALWAIQLNQAIIVGNPDPPPTDAAAALIAALEDDTVTWRSESDSLRHFDINKMETRHYIWFGPSKNFIIINYVCFDLSESDIRHIRPAYDARVAKIRSDALKAK